jgi:hypothetical protein
MSATIEPDEQAALAYQAAYRRYRGLYHAWRKVVEP